MELKCYIHVTCLNGTSMAHAQITHIITYAQITHIITHVQISNIKNDKFK